MNTKDISIESKVIEWLRFFCAALIVLAHSGGFVPNGYDSSPQDFELFDSFVILFSKGLAQVGVPVFFFISGYLFFIKLETWNQSAYFNKLKRRVSSLLVPYIIWNVIAIMFGCAMHYIKYFFFDGGSIELMPKFSEWTAIEDIGISSFWHGRGGLPYNGPLWFIRNLMVLNLLGFFIYFCIKKLKIFGILVLMLVYIIGLPIEIPGFEIFGIFFFSVGGWFSLNKYSFADLFAQNWKYATLIAIPLLIGILVTNKDNESVCFLFTRLFLIVGSILLIGITKIMLERGLIKINKSLSNSSFFIFASHGTIIVPTIGFLLTKLLPVGNEYLWIIAYFSLAIIAICVSYACFLIMGRFFPKTLSLLTGNRG